MLAARHRQNYFCIPANRLLKCEIRCRIAGMQCNHHIYFTRPCIIGNISLQKFQFLIAIFLTQFIAVTDYIRLQIQSDHADIVFLQFMQIIIHGKCQIRLATSKIKNCNFPVFWKLRQHIFYKFKKTVDLPELVKLRMHDLPIGSHNTQITQKRHHGSFFQNIVFLPVVRKIYLFPVSLLHSSFDGHFSFLTDKNRIIVSSRLHLHLFH